MWQPRNAPLFRGSIYSLVQQSALQSPSSCFVVAITSAHAKSGVTHVSEMLVDSLNQDLPGSAALVDCRELSRRSSLGLLPEFLDSNCSKQGESMGCGGWRASPEFRKAYIQWFRDQYSYVVLDCPPISESSEVLGLATIVDGVISVVEANRTKKMQISYLERTIEQSGGMLLGHVLNKRTFLIPKWLNAKLERVGI